MSPRPKVARVLLSRVLHAAAKELPFRSDQAIEHNLSFAAGSLAEAYRIGAEEAQAEILRRLRALDPELRELRDEPNDQES